MQMFQKNTIEWCVLNSTLRDSKLILWLTFTDDIFPIWTLGNHVEVNYSWGGGGGGLFSSMYLYTKLRAWYM